MKSYTSLSVAFFISNPSSWVKKLHKKRFFYTGIQRVFIVVTC